MSSHPDEISGATRKDLEFSGATRKDLEFSELIYRIEQQLINIKPESVDAYYCRILEALKCWWKKGTVTAETKGVLRIKLLFTYKNCKCCKFMISVARYGSKVIVKYKSCSSHIVDDDFTEALGIIEERARTVLLLRYGYSWFTYKSYLLSGLVDRFIKGVGTMATPTDHDKSYATTVALCR
jgi:hypothetical protein